MDANWLQQLYQSLSSTINGFQSATPEQLAMKADPSVAANILNWNPSMDPANVGAPGGTPSFDAMLNPQSTMQAVGMPVGEQSVVNTANPGTLAPQTPPGLTPEQVQKLMAMMPASERKPLQAPGVVQPRAQAPMAQFTVGGQQSRLQGGANPTLGSLIRGGR